MQSFPCHFNEFCLKALFKQKPLVSPGISGKKVNICNRYIAVIFPTLARAFISFLCHAARSWHPSAPVACSEI